MSAIDLHMHSSYSGDGEYTVRQLIDLCARQKIKLASITDHNSVKSVAEALEYGKDAGICMLPGVELDCTYQGKSFHLLGYAFDHTRPVFSQIEQDILRQEQNAAVLKIQKFRAATGLAVTEQEVLQAADGKVVTGELIAEIVLGRQDAQNHDILKPYLPGGEKSDMPFVHIYWDYFSAGKAAYVPIQYLSFPEAIRIIHEANGIAVLAHPGQNLDGDYTLFRRMIQEGLDGAEVFSTYHSKQETANFYEIASEQQILITGGSDFHGKTKPQIALGAYGGEEIADHEEIILKRLQTVFPNELPF